MIEAKIEGLRAIVGRAKKAPMLSKGPFVEQAVDWIIEIIEAQQVEIERLTAEVAACRK